MPMKAELYPINWDEIATALKVAVAWRCEACGKQCRRPGEPLVSHRFTLTVHHRDHVPANCADDNLIALCAPCHLRADASYHGPRAAATRYARRDALNLHLDL